MQHRSDFSPSLYRSLASLSLLSLILLGCHKDTLPAPSSAPTTPPAPACETTADYTTGITWATEDNDTDAKRGTADAQKFGYDDGKKISIDAAYQKGYNSPEGYSAGYKSTYQSAYDIGVKDIVSANNGKAQGQTDGLAKGQSEGAAQGKIDGSNKAAAEGTADGNKDGSYYGQIDGDYYGDAHGYDDGDYDGRVDGKDDGYHDGHAHGYSDGYNDGYSIGYSDGANSCGSGIATGSASHGRDGVLPPRTLNACQKKGYDSVRNSQTSYTNAYNAALAANSEYQKGLSEFKDDPTTIAQAKLDGYAKGQADGTAAGSANGKSAAYNATYTVAYSAAYNLVFNTAYNKAYNSYYKDNSANGPYQVAYKSAYSSAYTTAYNSYYASAYAIAYHDQYWSAYHSSYDSAYHDGDSKGYDTGWSDGDSDGFADGKATCPSGSDGSGGRIGGEGASGRMSNGGKVLRIDPSRSSHYRNSPNYVQFAGLSGQIEPEARFNRALRTSNLARVQSTSRHGDLSQFKKETRMNAVSTRLSTGKTEYIKKIEKRSEGQATYFLPSDDQSTYLIKQRKAQ